MKLNKKFYLTPAIVCLLGIVAVAYFYFLTALSVYDETRYLYIDEDDTVDSVYAQLEPLTSKHSLAAFRILSRHHKLQEHLHTGRYAIEPGKCTALIFKNIWNGRQQPMKLTIPESRTTDLLAGRLGAKLMADSADIAQALADPAVCDSLGFDTNTIAAMFIPNTYEVYWNTSVGQLLQRMKKEYELFWNSQRKQQALALGLTPVEVATLASIIDEETNSNDEKPMVAGMYLNRLNIGMPLQADPTVKFALKDFSLRRIYQKHLTTDSPYNTYRHAGLPPGPIKVASIQGTEAVLNRVNHKYLYMCAKEDLSGKHNFAATYQEHQQNAQRYADALNKRGIK